jgi:hypothetical protein
MSAFRRIIAFVLPAMMLFVGVSPVAADSGGHDVFTGTVSFTIPADQCPLLPAGVSVEGSGESVAIVNTSTQADGSIEVRVNNLIKGIATDSNGGTHKFVYHNSSTETIPLSGPHTISMNDSFVLSGPGPNYSVTFNWRWTYDPDVEEFWPPANDWELLSGDPDLIFACDPL